MTCVYQAFTSDAGVGMTVIDPVLDVVDVGCTVAGTVSPVDGAPALWAVAPTGSARSARISIGNPVRVMVLGPQWG